MYIDNASLLIAISVSGASLMVALLVGWMTTKRESYVLRWTIGIALVVASLAVLGLRNGAFELVNQLVPYFLLLTGFAFIYSGGRTFRRKQSSMGPAAILWAASTLCTALPLILGHSGFGLIMLNLWAAVFMFLCAWEYWEGRAEAQATLIANAVLYAATGISFVACAVMIVVEGNWVLTAPPNNLAEDLNSIISLIGITGIGGLSLTLNHARLARRHRHEANTDSLTGVLNRRALFSRIAETNTVPGLAVLMFDLDQFKLINDQRGHAQGDLVLLQFVDVLRSQLRHNDIVARLGGEEFCVVLPGLATDEARNVAERIRTNFADLAIPTGKEGATATVSAGLATGGIGETFSSVLSRADSGLYKAKTNGRNQVQLAAPRLVA